MGISAILLFESALFEVEFPEILHERSHGDQDMRARTHIYLNIRLLLLY